MKRHTHQLWFYHTLLCGFSRLQGYNTSMLQLMGKIYFDCLSFTLEHLSWKRETCKGFQTCFTTIPKAGLSAILHPLHQNEVQKQVPRLDDFHEEEIKPQEYPNEIIYSFQVPSGQFYIICILFNLHYVCNGVFMERAQLHYRHQFL